MTSARPLRLSSLLPYAIALALSLGCLGLSGCHPKSAATPENFTRALNTYFPDHPDCLLPDAPRFPLETSDPVKTKQLNAMVKVQLLTVAQEPAIHVSRFTPTDAGARVAPRFCYGHRQVTAIDSFTPPAQVNGFPETHVTYRYTMKDVPIWADNDGMKQAFPDMAQKTSGNATGTAVLAATMAGWQVPD